MFGTKRATAEQRLYDEALVAVLDRRGNISVLAALIAAVRRDDDAVNISHAAIAFDSTVFLRMGDGGVGADIVDYINTRHKGPLILPGQAVQEFWNNQLNVVDTVADKLKKKFEDFRKEAEKVGGDFGVYAETFSTIISEFGAEYGYVYEEGVVQKTIRFLEILERRATVPFVARSVFDPIAAQRKRTKTPPGFRDVGDGDFFVWADILRGLQISKKGGSAFEKLILVTLDKKDDWSRGGRAHPVLAAEVRALFGVGFEICDMKELAGLIATAI